MISVHDINEAAGQIATERHGNYAQLSGPDETAYDATYLMLCDLVDENENFESVSEIISAMCEREG